MSDQPAGQFITDEELNKKLHHAREAGKADCYRDLLKNFISSRGKIANLLAHEWQIVAVEMHDKYTSIKDGYKATRFQADSYVKDRK